MRLLRSDLIFHYKLLSQLKPRPRPRRVKAINGNDIHPSIIPLLLSSPSTSLPPLILFTLANLVGTSAWPPIEHYPDFVFPTVSPPPGMVVLVILETDPVKLSIFVVWHGCIGAR